MTTRFNGTTPNFFATMTVRPPKIVDKPHRHVSSAMNYYFHGSGRSTVEGKVYEWKAGDLMRAIERIAAGGGSEPRKPKGKKKKRKRKKRRRR